MKNRLLSTLPCLLALSACGVGEQVSEVQASSIGGGPITLPTDDDGGVIIVDPIPRPLPGPVTLAYIGDCDGDGVNDCVISVLRGGVIGGFSTQIKYTNPATGETIIETICNGDYNGTNPADENDDQPCNAPACSDANGPHVPPDVNFPPDGDGPCHGQTAGEVCVPFGFGSVICDCVTFDPESGLGELYPDDTDGDGVNDCPPPPP